MVRRFRKKAADGPVEEQPWITETSVKKQEEVRAREAEVARKARLRKRRYRKERLKKAGYDTDSDSDDYGEDLFEGDNGVGEVYADETVSS